MAQLNGNIAAVQATRQTFSLEPGRTRAGTGATSRSDPDQQLRRRPATRCWNPRDQWVISPPALVSEDVFLWAQQISAPQPRRATKNPRQNHPANVNDFGEG
jgi:hypothetical protein